MHVEGLGFESPHLHQISRLTSLAQAEAAYKAGNPHEECPASWDGATARIEALKKERDGIILAAKGELLAAKMKEKREIEQRIEKAKQEREHADKAVAVLAEDETVARFLNGGSEARRRGWGFSWAASFVPWLLSVDINGKPKARYAGLTSEGAFFTDPQRCPAILLFNEQALTVLDAEMQQRAALLRLYPELAGVS